MIRSALGKGLGALISDDIAAPVAATPEKQAGVTELPIEQIKANPRQPRQVYAQGALDELAASIRESGVLQPILVASTADGNYEIIAGERRWRASKLAGLKTMPAVVKSATEGERFQMALIENIQREDLNPLEQAHGFSRLAVEFHMTQEAIAKAMGKDRAVVANTLRLLNLSEEMQGALAAGTLSASHARSLVAVEDLITRQDLFKRILEDKLSVRAVEEAVRNQKQVAVKGHVRGAAPAKSPEARSLEEDLQRLLARKVELQTAGPNAKKGWLKLEFYSLDDLDHLIARLKRVSHS